jgi:hypothetical protein
MILNHIFKCEQIKKKWQDPSNKKKPTYGHQKKTLITPFTQNNTPKIETI